MSVHRFDHSRLDGSHITSNGFLKADAVPTRSGIFVYKMGDGSIRRELRHPEEVFSAESLKTLTEAPVTNDHPEFPVDAENAKQVTVGFTGSDITRKDNLAQMRLTIFDAHTIKEIMNGEKQELSGGYLCDVEITSGEFNGETFDAVQKNIRYNHLAVVKVGRAGPEARIKLDSADGIMIDKDAPPQNDLTKDKIEETENQIRARVAQPGRFEDGSFRSKDLGDGISLILGRLKGETTLTDQSYRFSKAEGWTLSKARTWLTEHNIEIIGDASHLRTRMCPKKKKNAGDTEDFDIDCRCNRNGEEQTMAKIKIDSVEYELSEAVAPIVAKKLDELSLASTDAKKKLETLQGKADGLEVELKKRDEEIKTLKESTLTEKDILSKAKGLQHVHDFAKKTLGDEIKIDEMEIAEIKKLVVQKVLPDVDMKEKTDLYIDGVFDTLYQKDKDAAGDDLKIALANANTNNGKLDSAQEARKKSMERSQKLWQQGDKEKAA